MRRYRKLGRGSPGANIYCRSQFAVADSAYTGVSADELLLQMAICAVECQRVRKTVVSYWATHFYKVV